MQRIALALLAVYLSAGCASPYRHIPLEPPTLYATGEDAFVRGDYETAEAMLERFLQGEGSPTYRVRAYYLLAQAQYREAKYQDALETLRNLKAEFPHQTWVQVEALQGDIEYALGNRTTAILAWEDAFEQGSPAEREILKRRMQTALAKLSDQELQRLFYSVASVPEVRDLVRERVEVAGIDVGAGLPVRETEAASKGAKGPQVAALPAAESDVLLPDEPAPKRPQPPPADSEETRRPDEDLLLPDEEPAPLEAVEPGQGIAEGEEEREPAIAPPGPIVAAMLPLTGPDGAWGQRALAGLRLAFRDAGTRLLLRDTGSDPVLAAQILKELADDPEVVAVIGPLRAEEAEVVAPRASRFHIPVMMLAPQEGLANDWVLQLSLTRQQQVRALVTHAVRTRGVERFGVLYPDDGYGRGFKTLFAEEVKRQGGKLVGTRAYVPGQPEFSAEIAAVRNWIRSAKLEALFIPDAAFVAAALGAAVRAHAPDLLLLGTESWNRPSTLARIGTRIDGAVFADAFYADSPRPTTRNFVEEFRDRLGRAPTVFEAQAFDAGMLVRRAIEEGATSRDEVLAFLRGMGRYEGASLLVAAKRGFQPEIHLLEVSGGKVREILD